MEIMGNAISISFFIFMVIIAAYSWYTFSIVYHLIRFGVGRKPKVLTFIYFIGSFMLLGMSVIMYKRAEWPEISQIFF